MPRRTLSQASYTCAEQEGPAALTTPLMFIVKEIHIINMHKLPVCNPEQSVRPSGHQTQEAKLPAHQTYGDQGDQQDFV